MTNNPQTPDLTITRTFGVVLLQLFLVVAITGVPFSGEPIDPDRTIVYPNF